MRRTLLAISTTAALACAFVSTTANASITSYFEDIIHYNVAYSGFKAMKNNGHFAGMEQRYQNTVNDLTSHNYASQAEVCEKAVQNIHNSYTDITNVFNYLDQHNSHNTHFQNGTPSLCLAKYEAFLGSAQMMADAMGNQTADQVAASCANLNTQANIATPVNATICEGNA